MISYKGPDYDMHLLTIKSDNIEETYQTLKERGVTVSEIKINDGNRKNIEFTPLW